MPSSNPYQATPSPTPHRRLRLADSTRWTRGAECCSRPSTCPPCGCWCSQRLHPLSLRPLLSHEQGQEVGDDDWSRDTGSFCRPAHGAPPRALERPNPFLFINSPHANEEYTGVLIRGKDTCARTHVAHLAHAHTPLSPRSAHSARPHEAL